MKKTMTHRLTRAAMVLFFAMFTTNVWAQTTLTLSGEGTEGDPYLIETAADWDNLADYVAGGNNCDGLFFKMTANIGTTENPITKPLGKQAGSQHSDRKRFAGTFDGNGNTLTVNITNENNPWFAYNKSYCAPFAYVQNVTIKNLHVTGTIVTTGQFASGLVGQSGPDNKPSLGACTINNCHVSVNFVGNTTGNGTNGNHGTFISIAEGNATITDSWFDGSLTGKNYYYSGGFIGLNKATANLSNCLFNPSEITIQNNNIGGSSEFVHNISGTIGSLTNCYYTKSFSEPEDAQGTKVYASYDPDESLVAEVNGLPDGNTYYIILHNINWMNIQDTMNDELTNNITVNLPKDITAGSEDTALVVPAGKAATINLNGFTLDRGLDIVAAQNEGYVLMVENGASLTINDLSEGHTGIIKGGNNIDNGGAIYNEGTLVISDITLSGNFANKGGAIYINGGEVTVNGGTICGNKATTSDGISGSGIFLNNGTLTLNGCTIKENNSNKNNNSIGVGVYVNNGTLNIQGKVNIKDNKCSMSKKQQNVYLTGNEVVNVTSSINRAFVRVSKENGGVITNCLNGNGNTSNFASDDSNYTVCLENEEAALIPCIKITINGYGNNDGGYYLIASPFNVNPAEVSGMTTGNYDLYAFDESKAQEWRNYQTENGQFNLERGKGYLYAKSQKVTLTFAGTPNNADFDVTLSKKGEDFPGWNLVGNPFTETAYIDRDFYTMNSTGSEIIAANNPNHNLDIGEAVFVIANQDNETMTFSTVASSSKGGRVVLNISHNSSDVIDRAIVRFDEGGILPKFQLNENSTKIYLTEDNQDYAVIRHTNESKMPVNFKASENGSYTLSVDAENMEMDYLHLIDNLTGEDVDLLQTPSYTFSANTSDYTSRFHLVFFNNGNLDNNEEPFAYCNGNTWIISNNGDANLQVIDVNGRLLSSEQISGDAKININNTPGVYILRLVNENEVKVQKIIIK